MNQLLRGFILILFCYPLFINAQTIDESQNGAWYMYFFDVKGENCKVGVQGDIQHRNWNMGGDLEQLLIRGGITYRPNIPMKLTAGYGNITTGAFGESKESIVEHRVYQEALFSTKMHSRLGFTHRLRYEQRFMPDESFRTRYRYNMFMNVLLNNDKIDKNTIYLSFYNEIFINGETEANGNEYQIFDRNRTYGAIGLGLSPNTKAQLGMMRQITNGWSKNQIQLSFHHNIRFKKEGE